MAAKNLKKKKKPASKKPASGGVRAKTRLPEEKSQHPVRRFHEVFGILTLAAALLLGPSLISIQFGEGDLMGPFGKTIGAAMNGALGLSGYLFILALLVVAVRIFAGGLEIKRSGAPLLTLWRERFGMVLATLFVSLLLHLLFRPHRLEGASYGGLLGEVSAEILCSLVSNVGAWILGLSGLALSLVLSTNFSWARAGLKLWTQSRRLGPALGDCAHRSRAHLRASLESLGHMLRRGQMAAEADGTAAMPPVVRLDLSKAVGTEAVEPDEKFMGRVSQGMPSDLEIGTVTPPAAPAICLPDIAPAAAADNPEHAAADPVEHRADAPADSLDERDTAGNRKGKNRKGKNKKSEGSRSQPRGESAPGSKKAALPDSAPRTEEEILEALTIVEPSFDQAGLDEAEGEDSAGKRVEPTDGPGFVLNEGTYQPPPVSLLVQKESDDFDLDRDAIYEQADRLVKTLADYKIKGRVTEVHPGPVVTMYEFVPAPGTRISKIASLTNDLAMSLAAQRVRIVAPIPGKGAIGIEVPNESRTTVFFKEIVTHKTFRKSKSPLTLAMGKNIVGAPVTLDLAKMPHLLVAGATGAGKSVSINAMICSLLLKSTPEEVRMIMVDPKYLELSGYNDIPHLMLPVVTDPAKANTALRWAVREMERRYQLLADMKVRDIKSFNRKVDRLRGEAVEQESAATAATASIEEAAPSRVTVVRKNADGTEVPVGSEANEATVVADEAAAAADEPGPPEPTPAAKAARGDSPKRLPYIVVIIDEFADLMMVASKEVETSVARLAQKARAAGIHVILATQRPSVDVITGLIKANFPSRISFQVASGHDSKTILGTMGAENLLGAGDMLVLDRGCEMKRLHGAFITDEEIQRVVDHLKEQGRPVYDMDILKPTEEEADPNQPEEIIDAMYDQAVSLVAESRQASISMIQRRLRVGYNRAARMVEKMEKEGVVGPPDGVRGREVLISPI